MEEKSFIVMIGIERKTEPARLDGEKEILILYEEKMMMVGDGMHLQL